MKRGALTVGTILIIVNAVIILLGMGFLEFVKGGYSLQGKMIVTETINKQKCTTLLRTLITEKYSSNGAEPDSSNTDKLNNFYGPEEKEAQKLISDNAEMNLLKEGKKIVICEGDRDGIDACKKQIKDKILYECEEYVYNPSGIHDYVSVTITMPRRVT